MPISAQLPVPTPQPTLSRGLDLGNLAKGQVLEGRSLGQSQGGQTLVAVGRQIVSLDLPQKPAAGTALRLEVQGDGAGRQLALVTSEPGEPVPLPPATKAALQALLLANAGKTISGQVLANGNGTTTVVLGKQVVDLKLPFTPQAGTTVRFQVGQAGNSLRLLPNLPASQPAALPLTLAVSPQSQPVLARLSLLPGQRVPAQVLANLPSGESEILVQGQRLTVTLPQAQNTGALLDLQAEADGAGIRLTLVPSGAAANPSAAKPGLPSPLQALLSAVGDVALADQDSLGPALATLNRLLAKTPDLPPAIAKAAQALLAAQLSLDGDVSGEELRQALARSGVFADPALAGKTDIKSALLQLRSALVVWLGPDALGSSNSRRPAPPARGGVPRSQSSPLPAGDDGLSARDLARALLGEANSALHRMRLFQLAALPDTTPGSEASKPSQVLVEIPVRLGQELCMAQFQVGRDGANGNNQQEARRGWQMRFSVNFSAIGEVGAQIGLLGHRVNISIWAERSATAEALQSMLPEVTQALAAKGIETVSLQCRHGIPKAPNPPPSGLYVDAVR